MASSSSNKNSCLLQNILSSCLNFTLLLLSLTSLLPIILIRNPPSSLGLAFLAVSLLSLLSSFAGASRSCFVSRVILHVSSLMCQVMVVYMLFSREKQSLELLISTRDPREAKALVRIECGVFVAMVSLQVIVLVLAFVSYCYYGEKERKCRGSVSTVEERVGFDVEANELKEKYAQI